MLVFYEYNERGEKMANIRMGLRLLETLTSALYDDPIILFREYVQNSVDAYNLSIENDPTKAFDEFSVSISVDHELSSITIEDNGYGVPEEDFYQKMTDIGLSDKTASPDQIGFRGIGRLSAMPFCDKLTFINKPMGLNKCLVFTWDGSRFHELLRQDSELELNSTIDNLITQKEENYNGNIKDHFFRVIIEKYNKEISELVSQEDFKDRLKMLLPLKYDPEFTYQNSIRKKYSEYMNEPLDKFSFIVKLNGEILYKPYKDYHILESGIYYWELKYRSSKKGIPGEKIGLLWFTFKRKMEANPKDEPYGILLRSKNMLMGNNNALADAIVRSKSDEYVTTYRELTQTLRGVYGEMLIHSPRLKDNARRDWFKIDSSSIELRDIIIDFMKRLHNYRYIASKAFSAIENDKNKEKLINAFTELTANYEPKEHIEAFYAKKRIEDEKKKHIFEFADDDIPQSSVTIKRFYDKVMKSIRDYYSYNENLQEFLKIRAHIKKELNKELTK